MAGIQELRAMVGDNPEALEIASGVEQTIQQNLNKVTQLEKQVSEWSNKFADVVASRDKVKDVIKNELGIEEFSPESVRTKLATYASDDAIAARDRQFTDFKATSTEKLDSLQKEIVNRDGRLKDMQLQLAISKTDVMGQTKGEHANEMLMSWISENAEFDDGGNIIYRGGGGETLFNKNGDPLTLEDRINEIKSDAGRDFVFQSRFLSGGGAPTEKPNTAGPAGGPNGGSYTRTTMSTQEKIGYAKKYGDEAYSRLPLV